MLSWRYATLHYSTQGVLSAASRGYGGGPLYQSGLCITIEAMLGEGDKVAIRTGAAGKTKCAGHDQSSAALPYDAISNAKTF